MKIDKKKVFAAFATAKFVLPPQAFVKRDPRGSEYGHFEATLSENETLIVVRKIGGAEPTNYTMLFGTTYDFVAWASEQT